MYMHMYAYMYLYVYICIYIYMYMYLYMYMHMCMCVSIYKCIHMFVYIYTYNRYGQCYLTTIYWIDIQRWWDYGEIDPHTPLPLPPRQGAVWCSPPTRCRCMGVGRLGPCIEKEVRITLIRFGLMSRFNVSHSSNKSRCPNVLGNS